MSRLWCAASVTASNQWPTMVIYTSIYDYYMPYELQGFYLFPYFDQGDRTMAPYNILASVLTTEQSTFTSNLASNWFRRTKGGNQVADVSAGIMSFYVCFFHTCRHWFWPSWPSCQYWDFFCWTFMFCNEIVHLRSFSKILNYIFLAQMECVMLLCNCITRICSRLQTFRNDWLHK